MKHGKGEKAMSEEEVLEALEATKKTLMRTARCFFSCYADCEPSKSAFIKHGEEENLFRIQSISKHGRHASLLMSAKRC